MRTGIATVPLDYGRCPRWLFERMKRLSRGIVLAIVEEFGPEEFLKRISDPVWFQSFGCVLGFDYNSSGLTVTTLGALKAGLFDIQDILGLYICGGKRTSRETPQEIEAYGISRGFEFAKDLIYASRMTAKVDSALLQDGYQIYQHNFLFTKNGVWAVIQQGMNTDNKTARRYHWFSQIKDFIEEPHSGIISHLKVKPLNLTAKSSQQNRESIFHLVKEEPTKVIIKHLESITLEKSSLFTWLEMKDKEFHWHPVVKEKFDLKRLEKTISLLKEKSPNDFQSLVGLEGVGPKTIRALSLIGELIYGAKPSYEDPARYTFAFGGKDGTPYFVERDTYDKTLEVIERGILKSKTSLKEKELALKRLAKFNL